MPGRPPLRIGQHGKKTRTYLGGGVWMARCRYRDSDGVTRIVERRGPADDHDKHGTLAEDGRAVRTIDTYRYTAGKLTKLLGAVRVGEATAPRMDAALP
jgi:hypothetical protein